MDQSVIDESKQIAEETRQKAQEQATLDARAANEILDKATATVKTVRAVWGNAQAELLKVFGETPENRQKVFDILSDLQFHHINAVYNGVQFIDMYNYHMNGAGDWDLGARYTIDDFVRGFLNHAPAVPLELLNTVDPKKKANPLYTTEPLPVSRLEENPVEMRIPVRVETFDRFYTGYLENFRFTKNVNGNPIQIVTTSPAIRTKNSYITLNSVYRWYEITEELLRQDWDNKDGMRLKKSANPIGQAEPQPTLESNDEQGV